MSMKTSANVQLLVEWSQSGHGFGAEGLEPIPSKLSLQLDLPDDWSEEIKRSVEQALKLKGGSREEFRTLKAVVLSISPAAFGLSKEEITKSKY
jgi:hypothetical protein